jgi:hypothetical protein
MKKKLIIGIVATFMILVITAVAFSYQGWKYQRVQNWDKEKVVSLEGKITDADRPIITMDSNGKEYLVHLGPIGYWQDKGVKLEKGTPVKITGMVADINGKMNVYPQMMTIDGKELKLADENGVPAWAGNGRQNGWKAGNGGNQSHGRHGWQGQGNCRNQTCPCGR